MFQSPEGGFLHNFGRAWARAVRDASVRDLRFHDLRHTGASRLVMAGVDVYTVKDILGHKTLTMTLRYAHLRPGHQREALERLAPRVPDASGTRSSTQRGDRWQRACCSPGEEMVDREGVEPPTPGFSARSPSQRLRAGSVAIVVDRATCTAFVGPLGALFWPILPSGNR